MKTIFMSLMLFLALESLSNAQPLEQFQRGFTEDCVRLGQERDQDLDKMAANYINALRDLGEKAKQSGNLDAVLPVRDEIAAVEGSKWPLPLLGKTAPKRLRELRDTYIEERGKLEKEHSRRLSELVAKTTELLKQREVELTKAGDVDGAIAAREMARLISSDAMLQRVKDAAKNGMLETASVKDNGLSYPILRLQPGALIFTNRNYAFEKIPKQLENCSFVQTPIARPNTVAIEVVSSGLLYLASSTYKDSHRKWLDDLLSNGWNLCDFKIGMAYGHSPMIVLSKWYKEGKVEVPLLGPGGGSTLIFAQDKLTDASKQKINTSSEQSTMPRNPTGGMPPTGSLENTLKSKIWTYRSGDSTCHWTFLDGQRITSDGWSKPSKWETKDNRILIIHYGDGNTCTFDFGDLSNLEVVGKTNLNSVRYLTPLKDRQLARAQPQT
jgi:hypothetical protein